MLAGDVMAKGSRLWASGQLHVARTPAGYSGKTLDAAASLAVGGGHGGVPADVADQARQNEARQDSVVPAVEVYLQTMTCLLRAAQVLQRACRRPVCKAMMVEAQR